MHLVERTATSVRHSPILRNCKPLWDLIRPSYRRALNLLGRTGLERNFNGIDRILVMPELYNLPETYEPAVWHSMMGELRPGQVVVDVGAFIGLYTIAAAKRVGSAGRVYAFEPDPATLPLLRRQVDLNDVALNISILPYVVGDRDGEIAFTSGGESQSHVSTGAFNNQLRLKEVTLDSVFADTRVDLLKIDVEGFEERVLRGGRHLLEDPERAPGAIFIEVHPYAWQQFGTTSGSLIGLLTHFGYEVQDLNGTPIAHITEYGEAVARRMPG